MSIQVQHQKYRKRLHKTLHMPQSVHSCLAIRYLN